MVWRNQIDKVIKDHLEFQIRESSKYSNAYSLAKKPANAQLWCAIANLSRQILDLNLKIKFLENALKELSPKAKREEKKEESPRIIIKKPKKIKKKIKKAKKIKKLHKEAKALEKALKKF